LILAQRNRETDEPYLKRAATPQQTSQRSSRERQVCQSPRFPTQIPKPFAYVTLAMMQLCGVFQALGEDIFRQLVRGISIGKLKTYQIYERFKVRARLGKLNSETLRRAEPKLWARIKEGEEDFATDLAQVFLLSHLPMIVDVLNLLGIPNEEGFFDKDLKPEQYLTEGWQERVFNEFSGKYNREILLFYINHLDWELTKAESVFLPSVQHA
jgi:hypothetical protein